MIADSYINTVNKIIKEEIKKLKRSVLKENGNGPIMAHHYSNDEFETFDKKYLGQNTEDNASENLAVTAKIGFWFNRGGKNFDNFFDVKYEAALDIENPMRFASLESLADEIVSYYEDAEDFVQQMEDMGYDGIEVKDEEFGGISYVAFEPEQIRIIRKIRL